MDHFFKFILGLPWFVWPFVGTIIVGLIVAIVKLHQEIDPLAQEIREIEKYFCSIRNPIDGDTLESINDEVKTWPHFNERWDEFAETLVTVERNGKQLIYNTQRASVFINSEVLIEKNVNVSLYQNVPNILTGFGLLGTFTAIIVALTALSPNETTNQIEGIGDFIKSLGGKFVSSWCGLLGALVFICVEKVSLGKAEQGCLRIQHQLDRLFPQSIAEDLLLRIQAGIEAQTNALNHFNSQLATHLKQSFEDSIVPTMELLIKGVDSLVDVTEHLRKQKEESAGVLIDTIVTNFKSALTEHAGTELNQFRDAMATTSTLAADMSIQVSGLLNHSENLLKTQQQLATEHFMMVENKIQEMLSNFQKTNTEQQEKTNEGIKLVSEAFKELASEIRQETNTFVEQLKSTVHDMINDNQTWSKEFREQFSANLGQQAEFNNHLNQKIKESITESIRTLETAFDDHLSRVGARMDGVLDKVTNWASESSKELNSYADALATQSSSIVAAGDSIKNASSELDSMFKEQKEFMQSLRDATTTLRAVASAVSESAGKISTIQEVTQEEIKALTAQIDRNTDLFKGSEKLLTTQKELHEALDGGISRTLQAINEATREYSEHTRQSLGNYLSDFDKHLSDAISQLDGTVDELEEAMGDLSDVVRKTLRSINSPANSDGNGNGSGDNLNNNAPQEAQS